MSEPSLPEIPPAPRDVPQPSKAPVVQTVGAKVLVVDDDPDQAVGLVHVLELVGFTVKTAQDGPSALALARSFEPVAVLLDVGLPGQDGYQIAAQLRNEPFGERMLLIAATGHGTDEDRDRSVEAGFDYHLVKPINLGVLIRLLAQNTQ
jgi:two-component system CheB/CheR fusion protein